MPLRTDEIGALIAQVCAGLSVPCEATGPRTYAVTLPGTHKLATVCRLTIGDHAVRVEAFVMRAPEERQQEVWRWLLRRNARMYQLAFAIDGAGDIYVVGRVSSAAVSAEELDRLLGAVLTYADESFRTLLEMGFGSAIRRGWAWRLARGEPTANLAAFRQLAEAPGDPVAEPPVDPVT